MRQYPPRREIGPDLQMRPLCGRRANPASRVHVEVSVCVQAPFVAIRLPRAFAHGDTVGVDSARGAIEAGVEAGVVPRVDRQALYALT